MNKTLLAFALVLLAPAALAEEEQKCQTNIERSSNPVLELITVPFKIVAAFSHLPRCMIDHFPVEERAEK